ncbi:hypothetical protein GCM10011359_07100 [Nesterenkonia alkaliphila]|nr:hypothetical protein GCM10011359_07100 [Nesterenkonia alkaliphila]
MSQQPSTPPARRRRKRLAPSVKYEVFTSVLTNQATQAEIAQRYGVDRTLERMCSGFAVFGKETVPSWSV